ncbi:hypothetical protein ACFQ3Z_00195 [Streptomyces nogalater]
MTVHEIPDELISLEHFAEQDGPGSPASPVTTTTPTWAVGARRPPPSTRPSPNTPPPSRSAGTSWSRP